MFSILLGCDLINDPEALVVRMIIERFFSISFDVQHKLEKHRLHYCIISSMLFYVKHLLEEERVLLETTPLFDLQNFLVEILVQFILIQINKEKSNKTKNNRVTQNQFCECIHSLFNEINQYIQSNPVLFNNEKDNNFKILIIEAEAELIQLAQRGKKRNT